MRNSFRKNFSQDYLRKLFNERQEKNKYLNNIINNDIYISMISESYKPMRDIEKYLKDNYNVHSRYRLIPNTEKNKISNNNTIKNPIYYKNGNPNISKNLENNRYHFNNNINKKINKSYDYNGVSYGEKKHFPFITNKGSYLKIVNQSLVPNKERLIFMKKAHNNLENNKNSDNYYNKDSTSGFTPKYNRYKKNGIRLFNDNYGKKNNETNDSTIDNTRNSKGKYIRNKLIDSRINEINDDRKLEDQKFLSLKEKHYHPHSFDYEGSRFGDNTYNFFLNEPMRGNYCGVDWKFPPLYNYNTKIDYGKSFPDLW